MTECGTAPGYDGTGAIDQHSTCQPDRAHQLRCRAALESFARMPPNSSGTCNDPTQARNDNEEGTASALETGAAGKSVRTGMWCYSKGLQRRPSSDGLGEPDPEAYESPLLALNTTNPSDFEQIKITAVAKGPRYRKLTNPQASLDYDLEA